MAEEYKFGEELANSIKKAKPKDRVEVLVMIFKNYVAKMIEFLMERSGRDGLEVGIIEEVKRNLITEFRGAKLNETQRSEKMYEDLFDTTLQEILNYASHAHEGEDSAKFEGQVLDINSNAYVNEGGLFIPEYLKK